MSHQNELSKLCGCISLILWLFTKSKNKVLTKNNSSYCPYVLSNYKNNWPYALTKGRFRISGLFFCFPHRHLDACCTSCVSSHFLLGRVKLPYVTEPLLFQITPNSPWSCTVWSVSFQTRREFIPCLLCNDTGEFDCQKLCIFCFATPAFHFWQYVFWRLRYFHFLLQL